MRKSSELCVSADRRLNCLRTLVERCIRRPKNARRIAIRYKKAEEGFIGTP
jgi:hypothetical protein